jgi:hypothetical protein
MRGSMHVRSVALLALSLTFGCDAEPQREFPPVGTARPLPVADGLFYAVNEDGQFQEDEARLTTRESATALTIDLAGKRPRIVEQELPPGYARALARPGNHPGEVVVLTSGHDQYTKKRKIVPAEKGHLLLFNRSGQQLEVELGGNFGNLALSDDGRFAVCHQARGNQAALNGIDVVDLDASTQTMAPVHRLVTLGLEGRTPTKLLFSPTTSGFSRRLLVVLFPDAIQLLDLERPERGEISVSLKSATDTRTLQPQEVLFHRDGASGLDKIYIQSANSNQIMVLELIAASDVPQGFRPAPSFVTLPAPVSDFALLGSGEGLRVAALAGTLRIADPKIGESVSVQGAEGYSNLHVFEGRSPVDDRVAPRALLYASGRSNVAFVELGGQDTWASRAIEVVELGEALNAIIPLTHRNLVLGMHAGRRVSIIDLDQRRVVPIGLESNLAGFLLDDTPQHARLWTANQSGLVSVLDLVTRVPTAIPIALESSGEPVNVTAGGASGSLLLIPGSPRRVALVHGAESGRITVVNADFDPANTDATLDPRELVGFFYSGVLD